MSDLADVERAILAAIAQIVYPDGTAAPSLTGAPCVIYRGWPVPRNLDRDLAAGTINISVFAQDNEQKTTRFPREWVVTGVPDVTLTLTCSETTVTVGGTPASPLNAAVNVGGVGYVYAVQPGDTTTSVATALASLIAVDAPATSSGPVITISDAYPLTATVGGFGPTVREIRRQKRGFIVTFWCPDPDSRDALVGPVDEALSDIDYLSLPDGTAARLLYEKTRVTDAVEREGIYRRDLFYSVEYATTDTRAVAQIVDIVLNVADWGGNPIPPRPVGANALTLESGAYMLMEDGSRILLDLAPLDPHPLASLLLESGGYLLGEDGGSLVLESGQTTYGLLLEAGGSLLTEDGGRFLLDSGSSVYGLLLEAGGSLLAEDGSRLLLDSGGAFLLEAGGYLLGEDANKLLLEG